MRKEILSTVVLISANDRSNHFLQLIDKYLQALDLEEIEQQVYTAMMHNAQAMVFANHAAAHKLFKRSK